MSGTRHTALGLGAMAARNGSGARPASPPGPPAVKHDTSWMLDAACKGNDPETFYPLSFKGGPSMLQIDDAKMICRSCSSRQSCLDWALKVGDDAGILGGTTPDERKAIKRRDARARSKQVSA